MGNVWRLTFRIAVFLYALSLIFAVPALAEDPDVEYNLKAELLERFTRFIEWPGVPGANFLVGVVGEDPFGQRLNQVFRDTRVNGKPVEIREVSSLEDLNRCQMLFISTSESGRLSEILAAIHHRPVLTVADTDGFARQGVLINFYRSGEYIRFEVNQSAIEPTGLKFSSRLLKLARIVETDSK